MLKCTTMSELQPNLALVAKIMNKDYKYLTFTQQLSEALYYFSFPAQTVAHTIIFLPDNIAMLNEKL